MADNEKEIIKKIEAEALEAKPIVPEVLSPRRSAFLNKTSYQESSINCFNETEVAPQQSQIQTPEHCWSICNIRNCNGHWVTPNHPWIHQPASSAPYGPFAFQNNPYNPSWTGTWTIGHLQYQAFYDWVVSIVGPMSIGDTIQFDMSVLNSGMCTILGECAEILCLKYEGQHPSYNYPFDPTHWQYGFGWNVTSSILPVVSLDSCCGRSSVSTGCYDIGDIGPEGGIIFSVPGVGLNTSTNIYYEVAQNDIDTATTPSSCFNISCGDEVVTYDVTNGKATHQMLDDNEFTFYWNDTPNPPYPNVGSNPPPQVGDTLTAITPNLFADINGNPISTTTIISITPSTHPSGHGAFTIKIADQLTATLDQSGNNTLPFKFSLTTTVVSPCTNTGLTPFGLQGSEWGAYDIPHSGPPPTIQTSLDFGLGLDNTDIIHAFPGNPGTPTGGTHPWLNTHDIAATVCKNHGTTNDWFLPSVQEFKEMFTNVGPGSSAANQITFNPLTQKSEHLYWTSSQHIDTSPVRPAISGTLNNVQVTASPSSTGIFIPTISYNTFFLILPIHNPGLTVGCEISSQYLPSGTVITSISTQGPYDRINLSNNFNSAPANIYITLNYSCSQTGLQDPDKYAYAYDTITNNPKLAYRCHALSVRPIRRFECEVPVDEGITYDWRFSYRSAGTPGSIQLLEPYIGTGNRWITTTHTAIGKLQMTGYQGWPPSSSWPSGVGPGVVIVNIPTASMTTPITIGQTLNSPYGYLGPVMDIVTFGLNSWIIFGNYLGGSSVSVSLPQNANITIEWDTQILNPLYSPSVFGTNIEVGHPTLILACGRWDVRGNDMRTILQNQSGTLPFQQQVFNIKIYNQFEELIGDWDYKMTNGGQYYRNPGCYLTRCTMDLRFKLVSTNFVEPTLQSSVNPNVLDVSPYWGESGQGNGYLALTINDTAPLWNQNLTRGNTLNLENWIGTGINNRALNPNNPFYTGVSPDWNSTYNRFGWGVVCRPCGMGVPANYPPYCVAVGLFEYLAEVDFSPAVSMCSVHSNYHVRYPSYAFQNYAPPLGPLGVNTGQGWVDAGTFGCTANLQSKLIGPSENYLEEVNECFDENIKEIIIDQVFEQEQYNENISTRQKFINDKKNIKKETGPFGIAGYYPLYDTINGAIINSPTPIESRSGENTYGYHIHEFEGTEYYMPNGLEMGVTQFHGDYDGQIIPETIVEPEVTEDIPETIDIPPPIITELEEEPDEETPSPPSDTGY